MGCRHAEKVGEGQAGSEGKIEEKELHSVHGNRSVFSVVVGRPDRKEEGWNILLREMSSEFLFNLNSSSKEPAWQKISPPCSSRSGVTPKVLSDWKRPSKCWSLPLPSSDRTKILLSGLPRFSLLLRPCSRWMPTGRRPLFLKASSKDQSWKLSGKIPLEPRWAISLTCLREFSPNTPKRRSKSCRA